MIPAPLDALPGMIAHQKVVLASRPDNTATRSKLRASGVVPVADWSPSEAAPPVVQADLVVIDIDAGGLRSDPVCGWLKAVVSNAAQHRRSIVVIDRPNPLGGVQVAGPLPHPGFESRVAPAGVPLRHSLSCAELVRLLGHSEAQPPPVSVLPCTGWDRAVVVDGDPLLVVRPILASTPLHMTAAGSVTGWPTTLDGDRLADLGAKCAGDAHLTEVGFRAESRKEGLVLHIDAHHPAAVDGLLLALVLLEVGVRAGSADGRELDWRRHGDPAFPTPYAIDRLLGSPEVRLGLASRVRPTELCAAWADDHGPFMARRERVRLYPAPEADAWGAPDWT